MKTHRGVDHGALLTALVLRQRFNRNHGWKYRGSFLFRRAFWSTVENKQAYIHTYTQGELMSEIMHSSWLEKKVIAAVVGSTCSAFPSQPNTNWQFTNRNKPGMCMVDYLEKKGCRNASAAEGLSLPNGCAVNDWRGRSISSSNLRPCS